MRLGTAHGVQHHAASFYSAASLSVVPSHLVQILAFTIYPVLGYVESRMNFFRSHSGIEEGLKVDHTRVCALSQLNK